MSEEKFHVLALVVSMNVLSERCCLGSTKASNETPSNGVSKDDGWSVEESKDAGVHVVEKGQEGASDFLAKKQSLLPSSAVESNFPNEVVASSQVTNVKLMYCECCRTCSFETRSCLCFWTIAFGVKVTLPHPNSSSSSRNAFVSIDA